jgi:hypothetical protein
MSIFGKQVGPRHNYRGARRSLKKESWGHHCCFGLGVSFKLLITSILLILNSLLPFIPIPVPFRPHNVSHWLGLKSWRRQQERLQYMRGG